MGHKVKKYFLKEELVMKQKKTVEEILSKVDQMPIEDVKGALKVTHKGTPIEEKIDTISEAEARIMQLTVEIEGEGLTEEEILKLYEAAGKKWGLGKNIIVSILKKWAYKIQSIVQKVTKFVLSILSYIVNIVRLVIHILIDSTSFVTDATFNFIETIWEKPYEWLFGEEFAATGEINEDAINEKLEAVDEMMKA